MSSISKIKEKFPLLIEVPSKNSKLKFGGELYFKFANEEKKLDESITFLLKIIFMAEKVLLKLMLPFEEKENEITNKAG